MKLSYNIQQFKYALRRNSSKLGEIYYRGDFPSCARCFYMQTKKAYITYVPASYLDAYFVWREAVNNGYILAKVEDLIDAAK